MPARFRAPKKCKKQNVFPCKGECVRRYHWKSGKEQRCRNVATGTPATYLEWLKQQTKTLKTENTRRSKQGEALIEMDQAGYMRERPLPDRLTKSKTLPQKLRALSDKELDQAIKTLAKKGGSLELKRGLFAEKRRRSPSRNPQPTKQQTPLQSIQSKIYQASNTEDALRSFTDEELKLASKIFAEKNVGITSPYKRKLAAELRRRTTEKPESNVVPITKPNPAPQPKPDSPKVVSIDQGRPKMPAPKDFKEAIANGQKFLGKDYDQLQKLGKEYAALSKRLDPQTASASAIAQTEKRMEAIADQTNGIIRTLIDKSPISPADAEAMLKGVKLPKGMEDGDRQSLIDFIRLSNGQVTETLKQIQYTTRKRGKALVDRGVVEIRRGNTKSLWHELGHLVEYTEQNQQAAIGKAFVQSRATGKARKLTEINPKYRSIERYLPDDFVNPYIGKVYKTNTTEVFSMGIDALANPKRLLNLAAKDPEHLALTLGIFQQDYIKSSNVIPMGRQRQAAEVIGEDLPNVKPKYDKDLTDPLFAEKMVDKFMPEDIDYDDDNYEEEKAKRKVFDYYIKKYNIDPLYEDSIPLYEALEGDPTALSAYAGAWVIDEDDWEKYGLA